MKARITLSILVAMAAAASASAQTVQTFDDVFAMTPIAVGAPNFPIAVSLPEFNSNLGTLQSVAITLTSTIDASASVYNLGSSPESFGFAAADFTPAGEGITVTGPAGASITYQPSIYINGGVANPGSNDYGTVSSTFQDTVLPGISGYEAPGGGTLNFSVNSSALGTYSGSPGFPLFYGASADAGGDVKVTYTYAPIPEPATYAAVLGAAALGLAIHRRRQIAC